MKKINLLLFVVCGLLLTACGKQKNAKSGKWLSDDDVRIAIDETFRPIMEEELDLFGMRHPEAGLHPVFVSEHEALRLLVTDSIRACIVTRPLSEKEMRMVENHRLRVRHHRFAYDALALIVNKQNRDSLITLDELRAIVTGRITRWEQLARSGRTGELKLVFDNEGSSTVRYMTDSLCGGKPLRGNVYAQGTNPKVIELVKSDPDVIGVVGANWLKEKGDSTLKHFNDLEFNVMRVSRFSGGGEEYFRPYQFYIATGQYPLTRDVYAILTDPRSKSMLRNFYFFLKGQPAQLIICNGSQMLPVMPVQVKAVSSD